MFMHDNPNEKDAVYTYLSIAPTSMHKRMGKPLSALMYAIATSLLVVHDRNPYSVPPRAPSSRRAALRSRRPPPAPQYA